MFRRSPRKILSWFAFVFAVFLIQTRPALGTSVNYYARTLQVEQGLPQNKVTTVVQTRDGYLWVGTYNGLARFDGVRFTIFDDSNAPELRSSRITSLFEANDGALWIGTESGNVSQYKDGRFSAMPPVTHWSGEKISAITADNAGDVWLLNEAGELARARDGKVLSPPTGRVRKVVSLARAQDGDIWVEREGAVSVLKEGHLAGELFTDDYVQGFCAAHDGGFWVARNGGIQKWKAGKWVSDLGAAPWGMSVANLMETSGGALVGGSSDSGLWLMFPNATNTPTLHFDRNNGLPSDWVISLWEDREKNLWCGTGAGLVIIRPSLFETLAPLDKWKNRAVLSVLPTADGALWVGTEGAGLYRLQNGTWKNFEVAQGLRNPYVWSLTADNAGRIWAGTWGGGLFMQRGDAFANASGLENLRLPTPALLFAPDGLWIGTTSGALRDRDGTIERFAELGGESFGDVRAIAREKSGVVWFGTAGSGLVRLKDSGFCRFRKAEGLPSDFIECLHLGDDGALWIGTFGGGLARFKEGRFSVVNRDNGLPNSVIAHIEADGRGFFWMSSYGGILRAREEDLNRCADHKIAEVPFLSYGVSDGLPTIECSEGMQSAGAKTADGRLWFATTKGLVAVSPEVVNSNSLPPPVRIERMRVDDKDYVVGNDTRPLKISPGRHRIEFEYTGLSFVAPEKVRFRCRLNGFESDWANVGTKRVASYNYIPPGHYAFQVTACNNDGVWNETGVGLGFEILPFFWQTTWFQVVGAIGIVLAASGAVWFETRRRMWRRLERAERQRDIERERSRIAHDIHDDLGAHLTRITMMSESVRGELASPERAAVGLKKIYETALELTRSMDEIVWAVNPRHDTLESLATYLEKFAQDWLATAGIRCRLDLPLQFPECSVRAEVRHDVFLALKEALHNVVKHSGASEVLIRLTLEAEKLELTIEDNGRGFAMSQATKAVSAAPGRVASGNGSESMKRRLESLGGNCVIHSTVGVGTKVSLSVPIRSSQSKRNS